jgi:hypothetical protein
MIEIQSSGGMEALDNISPERSREIVWSYVEADEFVRAVDSLLTCLPKEILQKQLAKALKGPADLALESQRNSHGRNFMFELVIGGRLAAASLLPSFDRGPDLEFSFAGLRVAVQCKRPLSESGLGGTIKKAVSQLKKDKADLSLVAVSVSRLMNPGGLDTIPEVERPETAHQYLNERVRQIAFSTRRFWHGKIDRAGILFYAFTPIRWMQGKGHYGQIMERCEVLSPVTKGEPTETLLKSLAQTIGA